MSKLKKLTDAIKLIKDGDSLAIGGFVSSMHPEALSKGIGEFYQKNSAPKDLTLVYAAGQGDGKTKGLNHFAHKGLVKKVIGGHWGLAPKLGDLALTNQIEAYNFPQGVITHMFREIAANRIGVITKVGLHTFADPRLDGGKLNAKTQTDLVELIDIKGEEWLLYHKFPVDIALVRGTYCDSMGNCTFEKEALSLEMLAIAQACKNSGGKVILQVEKLVEEQELDYSKVKLPGIYVDAIVEADAQDHMQTFAEAYNPAYSQEVRIALDTIKPLALDERKVIARRALMELHANAIINLGIGMPEGVSIVAEEEGMHTSVLTTEAGTIGGVPAGGMSFGAATNPDAIIDQPYQFDFYDGGGLDVAYLGLAQVNAKGDVNVSKFGSKLAGCGGFINISQNSKKVVYMGTFTAGGLKTLVEKNQLSIVTEGKSKKFLKDLEHITFSGKYAYECEQEVFYITERCVFELNSQGLILTEIAPGIDLQKHIIEQMEFRPQIAEDLKLMDLHIFSAEKMNLINDLSHS